MNNEEKIEKKRAEVCAALTNMAAVCIDERLAVKEDSVHIKHVRKVLNIYFQKVLEKLNELEEMIE